MFKTMLLTGGAMFLVPLSAGAKLPPLSPKKLDAQATHIVEGTFRKPFKVGKIKRDRCYGWQDMSALFDVDRQHKGARAKVLVLRYAMRVEDNKGCDGGRTSYRFGEAKRFKLHLKCGWPKVKNGQKAKLRPVCRPFNWAGVKQLSKAHLRRRNAPFN